MSKPARRSSRTGSASDARPSSGPSGSPRAGRRERFRSTRDPSFFERHRSKIIGAVGIAAIGLIAAFVFLGASQPSYACSTLWEPQPTSSPAAGATPRLGYVQQDMGVSHEASVPQRYTLCPPASGPHFAQPRGPIPGGVYGPDDGAMPQGWIHNLEHGGLVVLYRCDGTDACTDEGQARFRSFYASFPPSPVCGLEKGRAGPVIARFDDMAFPYAAVLWGRVLPLQSFDEELILQFFDREAERTAPEPQCPAPTPSPAASPTPGPTDASPSPAGSPVESPDGSPGQSPDGSLEPSPTPS